MGGKAWQSKEARVEAARAVDALAKLGANPIDARTMSRLVGLVAAEIDRIGPIPASEEDGQAQSVRLSCRLTELGRHGAAMHVHHRSQVWTRDATLRGAIPAAYILAAALLPVVERDVPA